MEGWNRPLHGPGVKIHENGQTDSIYVIYFQFYNFGNYGIGG